MSRPFARMNSISATQMASASAYAPYSMLVLSDLHCHVAYGGPRVALIPKMLEWCRNPQNNTRGIIVCGDITDGGDDKVSTETDRMLISFVQNWYLPLNTAMIPTNGKFYLTLGNHDSPVAGNKHPRILNALESLNENNSFYSFDIGDVHYATVYLHPGHVDKTMFYDKDLLAGVFMNSMAWLTADLALHCNKRIVLFWHYDIHSSWWNSKEKNILEALLKKFKVKHIFVGHLHTCSAYHYSEDTQIPVSIVAARYFAILKVTKTSIDVQFMNSKGTIKTWDEMRFTPRAVDEVDERITAGSAHLADVTPSPV